MSATVDEGYWKLFVDGLQRVLIFTPDEGVIDRIKAATSYSFPLFEASLAIRNIGISLVDNYKKRELAYIAITQSGVIWQINKRKKVWKNVSNSLNLVLEEAYQSKHLDIRLKNLSVNLETMEMFDPIKGKLRRTHYDGLFVRFAMSEKDYSVQTKIGYVQIDNQLPFSVYPQVLYPVPPPPTVASATEPKPFVEASIILRRGHNQSTVTHFKYVHILVQKMAVNVDLGFILSLVDFFTLSKENLQLEAERVNNDVDYLRKSLKETIVPDLAEDFNVSRSFFDVLHLAPIKITVSFNIRSVGKNKSDDEITVGDRFLQLFLHSIGVILTSIQETEMKFSFFHIEYQPTTGRGLTSLLAKHYRNQALFQLHTIIFGLDALGNPVSVVRGVVGGAVDLFYEPIKGSVLGREEFLEGLSIGLRSFFAAGVLGGITGAGARITGTVGDVFAKFTFDEEFIDKRQQQKTQPPKLSQKLGGFAKNLFEGATGVVTQPVKGLQKGGAVGLLKGTGKGLVGFFVRPTGGLVDLASETLNFVSRKTQVGNIEIADIRPPRFIGRDGIVVPYSPMKAIGNALLVNVDEGKFVDSDFYLGHVEVNNKPIQFVLVTNRRFLLIERRVLSDGWKSEKAALFQHFAAPVEVKDVNVVINNRPEIKGKLPCLTLRNEKQAQKVAEIINEGYMRYLDEL